MVDHLNSEAISLVGTVSTVHRCVMADSAHQSSAELTSAVQRNSFPKNLMKVCWFYPIKEINMFIER